MHNLKDIQDRFGWSYMAARKRVMWLQENFSSEVEGGNGRKYQVTDNGLTILDRLNQVKTKEKDLSAAFKQVEKEMQGSRSKDSSEKDNQDVKSKAKVDQKSDKTEIKVTERYIDRLEAENDYLREKLDQKDRQLREANETIQGLITGEAGNEKPEASPWQLFKNWLFNT